MRIIVIGSTGSGKTTLARELAQRLGTAHVELDALHWGPDWTARPLETFRQSTLYAIQDDAWVVDGNYRDVRDIVWPRAELAVWLDYPFHVVLRRLVARTFKRARGREVLWNDNRERLLTQFTSRDSIFLWLFKSFRRHKREYAELFRQPEHAHITVVRLTSADQTRRWLDQQT
ncbi:MAG: adenylate kinase [Dehalococcoidia bacterium]